jgi:hypothetical protein
MANLSITLEFELKFCWVQILTWVQILLNMKTGKKNPNSRFKFLFELVGFFLSNVDIS